MCVRECMFFKPQTFQIVQHISQDQGVFQDFGRTERRRVNIPRKMICETVMLNYTNKMNQQTIVFYLSFLSIDREIAEAGVPSNNAQG